MLELVVLTIGTFFRKVRYGLIPRYESAMKQYKSDRIGMIGPLSWPFWTLALKVGIFWLMEKYDVHPVLVLVAVACADEINFKVADIPG